MVADQKVLDPAIHGSLVAGWPLSRVDATLRAILRAGAWELSKRTDVPAKVVIA